MDASELLAGIRLVPVLKLEDAQVAVPLARTLHSSGIRAMEITLRTATALDAIAAVAAEVPAMIVGAGSVRRPEQVEDVLNVGAEYLALPQVACTGGSWFVPDDSLALPDFARTTALADTAVAATRD